MAYWLGLQAFTAMPWVQSLLRELRSHKPHDMAKKKNYLIITGCKPNCNWWLPQGTTVVKEWRTDLAHLDFLLFIFTYF